MRILGIDYGDRRIGLAVSDPTGALATPLATLRKRSGKRPPFSEIEELVADFELQAIVVGLPLTLEGDENEWCAEVRRAGDALGRRLSLPVHYVDERLSSVQAERAVRSVGLRKEAREEKERVDAAAATLILQRFIDRRDGPPGAPSEGS